MIRCSVPKAEATLAVSLLLDYSLANLAGGFGYAA